ncbi:MAG: PIN domain-containing protein [Thermomicrobiales bacterium]
MSDGFIDTNVFIHALARDSHSAECLGFLGALSEGSVQAIVDPLIVHELTCTLPRFARQMSRQDIADFVTGVLNFPGVISERDLLTEALARWARTPGLGFVDAVLGVRAIRMSAPVYTKNVRHFAGHGVDVPDPLPLE